MSEMTTVSLVAMIGWLLVMVMGFASFRLSWGKTAQLALIWLGIIIGLYLIADMAGLAL